MIILNPLFIKFKILKCPDLIYLHTALFTFDFHKGNLPTTFNDTNVCNVHHHHNTRLASRSSYSLPQIRTNYGKFNIRYSGAWLWNSIDEDAKDLSNRSQFKTYLTKFILEKYLASDV